MPKCLVIDNLHPSITPLMEEIGYEVDYRPEIRREDIKGIISEFSGLIVRSKTTIDEDLIINADKLLWVGRAGAGIDKLDVQYLQNRGIVVVNAPEGNSDALAEHAIGMMLAVLNNFRISDLMIRHNNWDRERQRGYELGSMTVGIIGYGHMGKAVCKRLKGFGCRVVGYDKYLKNYSDDFIEESSLEELFADSDLLSLHIPLTDETRKMADLDFFNSFNKSFYLINTARGEIVDLEAMNICLESGKIKAAGLDVLENEKIKNLNPEETRRFEQLKSFENVLFTPHVGGWSFESYERINRVLVNKIREVIKK